MRKLLSFIMVAVFLFIATMEVSAMDAPRGRPRYLQVTVASVAELLEFIRTENVDTFQSGRYRDGIMALRERGSVFIPSFNSLVGTIDFRGMTIIPDNFGRDYRTVIDYIHFINDQRVLIFVMEANQSLFNELNSDIREYVVRQHADDNILTPILETTMIIHGEERTVPYVIVSREPMMEGSPQLQRAMFVVDGFEIAVIQEQATWSDSHLQNLHLTMYDIATGLPVDGVPIATPPPNDNNGENGVETPEPTPTVEPTPTIEPTSDVSNDERETSPLGLVVAISLGAVVIGGAVLWLLLWKRRRREEDDGDE